jgi:hypothetical protein
VTCNAGQVREERGGASSDSLIITRFQVGILKQRIPSTKRLWGIYAYNSTDRPPNKLGYSHVQ